MLVLAHDVLHIHHEQELGVDVEVEDVAALGCLRDVNRANVLGEGFEVGVAHVAPLGEGEMCVLKRGPAPGRRWYERCYLLNKVSRHTRPTTPSATRRKARNNSFSVHL